MNMPKMSRVLKRSLSLPTGASKQLLDDSSESDAALDPPLRRAINPSQLQTAMKLQAARPVPNHLLDLLSLKSQITELYCHTHSSDSQLTQHSKLTYVLRFKLSKFKGRTPKYLQLNWLVLHLLCGLHSLCLFCGYAPLLHSALGNT